ncbi:MAG: DUF1573 domain-containing protein [Sedimentisphaerales bacterium]|nr:DUF1573 domain-containing protein [Sedimentisphaerales bacterium]
MRRTWVVSGLLIVSCLLFLQAGCENGDKEITTTPGTGSAGPSPKITFEKLDYDFGEAGVNTTRTSEITFQNTGDALLKITNVEGCCGVHTKLDKYELSPGETGKMEMEWKTKPNPTMMIWRVTFHSNDKENPTLTLNMKAKLVQRITWDPERLKLCLQEENAGCPKIRIWSLDERPFSITGLKSTAECITADFDASKEAKEFVLEPKVDLEKIRQNLQGSLNLDLNHPEGSEALILFDVVPKYTLTPQLLIVYAAAPGKPITRKIKLLDNFGKTPEVESITSKGGTIAVKILGQKKIPDKDGCEIELEVTPTAPAVKGKTIYTDTFSINLKGGEELSIDCNAYYTAVRTKTKVQSEAT